MTKFEYKGFVIKQEKDWTVLYDSRGNYLKRTPSNTKHISHTTLSEMKLLIDKYCKEN